MAQLQNYSDFAGVPPWVAPTSGMSVYMVLNTAAVFVLSLLILPPWLCGQGFRRRREYPSFLLWFTGLFAFLLNLGFVIGAYYDFNPANYAGPVCTLQALVLVPFGQAASALGAAM